MFLHIFSNRFKCLIRNRETLIWLFLFPILLSTMFKLAIPDSTTFEMFKPIDIAVVNNVEYQNDSSFKSALSSVSNIDSKSNNDIMFNIKLVGEEEAKDLLKNNKIEGYIIVDNEPNIVVKKSGFNQTILKEFVNDYLKVKSQYINILQANPSAINKFMSELGSDKSYIKEVSPSKASPNDSLVYYYALIAMTCLYGGFLGIKEVINVQADQSSQGARVSLAPTNKLKVFSCSIITATILQMLIILTLLTYLKIALNIDFGNQIGYVILIAIAGSLTGVSFGAMIGSIVPGREIGKTAILMSSTMILSFLSGLMWSNMKYIVTSKLPIMAYINPANLISDAFYSLYYYDTYTRFYINIGILFGISIIFYLIVFFKMRRKKYASI